MDKRQDDRCIIDMERCPINTSIRDERIKSQHRGSDKRSPINQPAFGKEYFGADCIPSDKLDKLASPDMNSADDKSSNEIHSLKQLQHKVKYSGQRRPGKERIKSKHLSPFKRNVASSEIPLVTVDLKSKWDSPKRKSRWGTPDQYSIGMGLELPLIFANSWKGESGSSVIESKLSVHESAAVPKKEKIHFEGRKGENDTFSSPFKKMSPHHLKVDIEENKCDIGRRNAGDVNIQRLSDRDLEDSRDGIYRQPKMSPDLIDDRILSISSQKGKSYQRENIISSQNTGQEILLYVTRDEKDGTDESRRQEKGSIDDMYDVKQKIGEHDMKGRQRDNTDFNDAVSSPGGSKFAQPELIGSYYNQVSSEHLHPNSTSAPKNFPDLIKNTKSLTGTTYSRAESPQQRRSRTRSDRHVERQREMLKRHLKRIERPSSTHTWLGAKGFTKHFGFKSFEPSYKRFRSASFSFSFAREGMNKKFAATENRKERSRSKQLKLETAPRQKMKTRHGQRSSTTRSASSSSASSSTIASHSSVGIKDSFTDEKSTSFASKSDMTTGKLQTEDSKAQSKPESKGTTETTDKTNKKRKESLDELVKFLNQLKERKKEQLKAEGKIKGKNSENIP